jgi:hypothetical protein
MRTNAPDLSRTQATGGIMALAIRNAETQGRAVRVPWAALALAAIVCGLAAVTQKAKAQPVDDALILLRTHEGLELDRIVQEISSLGAHVLHVLPPRVLIGQVSEAVEGAVRTHPAVLAVYRTTVEPPDETGPLGEAALGIGVWNQLINPATFQAATLSELATPLAGDAFHPADVGHDHPFRAAGDDAAGSPPPSAYQTSEFMIGKIAVGIVLPESTGSGENWSSARQDQVIQEIVTGCNWWATRGGSSAHLTFFYEVQRSVPTQYEPIQRPYSDERLWITETLEYLGYPGANHFAQCRDYDNALRDRFRSDWAFTVFVVDSLNDSDGKFSDGYFAYAYLNGPFMVMTYDNNGYGIANTDVVMAHEFGHIFGALDEYTGASSCNARSGYLDIANGNHAQCNSPVDGSCVMRGGIRWGLCPFSRGQIGWRDSDGDGIFDPADTPITFTMNTSSAGPTYTFTGIATETAYSSPTHRSCSINTFTTVEYRVDGGPWLPATADDGLFDGYQESYIFSVGPLSGGTHGVEARARDNAGNTASKTFGTPVLLAYVDGDASCPSPNGTPHCPYRTFCNGYDAIVAGGTVRMHVGRYVSCRNLLTKAATLESYGGMVTLLPPGSGGASTEDRLPKLSPPTRLGDGTFVMHFAGVPGQRYHVFASTNLVTWELWRDFTAESDTIDLVDPEAIVTPMRFFRVVSLE